MVVGTQVGRLTVLFYVGVRGRNGYWRCVCTCGAERTIRAYDLRHGLTQSCGCWGREVGLRHGHAVPRSPTYRSWRAMMRRCREPGHMKYPSYGGRGIEVCARWRDFAAFLADMGERPEGCTIDRIDGSRGYELGNCRWATAAEQRRNRRRKGPGGRVPSR